MNVQLLNQYKDDGLLMNQFHPTIPLVIWNYTAKVQYEQLWDEITFQCRALVTDLEGNIVSRGFSKFFNIEENRHEPTDDFEVFEKLDGQYIGVFWYNGEMVVNSKGSFTSPYAIEAKRILEEKYPEFKKLPLTNHLSHYRLTYCFELIGFEQIVVSYPEPDIIMTGKFRNDVLLGWSDLPITNSCGVSTVKKFNGLDWKNIKGLNWQNSEGFVVRFSNGQRCKIKFEDYIKLHRQMTNLSTTGIWEALMNGEPVSSILNDVPDEFYDKVHSYENELKNEFSEIETSYKIIFNSFTKDFKTYYPINRTQFAHYATKYQNPSILFAMLDGKDYSKMIWKLIKPKFEKI